MASDFHEFWKTSNRMSFDVYRTYNFHSSTLNCVEDATRLLSKLSLKDDIYIEVKNPYIKDPYTNFPSNPLISNFEGQIHSTSLLQAFALQNDLRKAEPVVLEEIQPIFPPNEINPDSYDTDRCTEQLLNFTMTDHFTTWKENSIPEDNYFDCLENQANLGSSDQILLDKSTKQLSDLSLTDDIYEWEDNLFPEKWEDNFNFSSCPIKMNPYKSAKLKAFQLPNNLEDWKSNLNPERVPLDSPLNSVNCESMIHVDTRYINLSPVLKIRHNSNTWKRNHVPIESNPDSLPASIIQNEKMAKAHKSSKVAVVQNSKEKRFACNQCFYTSDRKEKMAQHKLRHNENVEYPCEFCHFVSTYNREFYRHMEKHYGGPPFKCHHCSYHTFRISTLMMHTVMHSSIRNFKCTLCPFSCKRKYHLKGHMVTHSASKPFMCSFCEKRYKHKCSLIRHLQTHMN